MSLAPLVLDLAAPDERWADWLDVHEAAIGEALTQALVFDHADPRAQERLSEAGCRDALTACVAFVDDATSRALNAAHRGQDKPTNVLSFPAAPAPVDLIEDFLGDIIIAFETTHREADVQGKTFEDHVIHLLIHGFLHVLGYDHLDDSDANMMESAEKRLMAQLGRPDPYGD